jgi:thermostable 8-oxoguanine DNA glycosylase
MIKPVLSPVRDPYCGRWSWESLQFDVDSRSWRVEWGRFDAFGSPAYWVNETVRRGYENEIDRGACQGDLESVVAFCLLGGYGVSYEMASEAHSAVMEILHSSENVSTELLENRLREPLDSGRRYRFPGQRSRRIASAVRLIRGRTLPQNAEQLRTALLTFEGVGPKTSAWIVRNYLGSDDVAIIDIWLVRALARVGIFPGEWNVARDYDKLESAFLSFARQGRVRPSALDLCIWSEARRYPYLIS